MILCNGDFRSKTCIFCAAVVNEKDFLTVRKLHRCNQREYPRQRRNCAAIDKDKAARLRGTNDNFLITISFFGSFVLLITVLFVAKGADTMPKRRANGEGNIRKRKDGRWEGRYTAGYDPESGKRIIKNVLGKTQAEVKEKLKAAISESQRLDVSKAGTYTVASWVRTWYEVYAEPRTTLGLRLLSLSSGKFLRWTRPLFWRLL